MALVYNIVKTIEIPNESVSVVIRKLSHMELKQAAKARQSEGVGFMRELGGELMKSLRDADVGAVKRIQETQQADINTYDRDLLLKTGIVSWTYDAKLPGATDFLDESTAKFLSEQIFDFSRPEDKTEAKNA